MVGKLTRLHSFVSSEGRTVIVPVDQPVTVGPGDGLQVASTAVDNVLAGGPDAIVAHRGLHQRGAFCAHRTPTLLHVSAGTRLSGAGHVKRQVGFVEDALRLGSVGVSMHITFGIPEERDMLADLGRLSSECLEWGLPLLVMVYVEGRPDDAGALGHAVRVAGELGADLIKLPFSGHLDELEAIVQGTFAPILLAGGARTQDSDEFFEYLAAAMKVGVQGACVGRQVFSAPDPGAVLRRIRAIVHTGERSPRSRELAFLST